MARPRQAPKKLTDEHLLTIDDLAKRDSHKGEMARFYAWQYLRMESLALELRLKSKKLDPQQEAALARMKAELFYWIGRGPKPEGSILFQGLVPLHARRAFAVFRPPDGQPHRYPNHFALYIDPSWDIDRLILPHVRKEILAERKRRVILNAKGQGPTMKFPRMWKALAVYEKYQQCKLHPTKLRENWWETIPGITNKNQAHKLTSLARKMVNAAMTETWGKTFSLR